MKGFMADIFGGLVLVAERPYRIGDKVSIGEYYGEVVDTLEREGVEKFTASWLELLETVEKA